MAAYLAQTDDLSIFRRLNHRAGRLGAVGDEVVAGEDAGAVARASGQVHDELEAASELRVDVDRDLRKARSRSAVVEQARVGSAGDVADARQHKSAITTAGDHDISYRNLNENMPCGLCELDNTQSRGVVWCVSDLHPTATARDDRICA